MVKENQSSATETGHSNNIEKVLTRDGVGTFFSVSLKFMYTILDIYTILIIKKIIRGIRCLYAILLFYS